MESNPYSPIEAGGQWTSTASIRPHHFLAPLGSIPSALKPDGRNIQTLARDDTQLIAMAGFMSPDKAAYIRDVLGTTPQDKRKREEEVATFFTELRNLPDEAVVHMDAKPDGICAACTIGEHCNVLNADRMESVGLEVEAEYLAYIRVQLVEEGLVEGADFIFKPTTHVYYDYHGEGLGNPHPEAKVLGFNSMLVKAGALRKIC